MKIRVVGQSFSMRMGRKKDMTTTIVAFRDFAKTPKNAPGSGIGK
jgi:hypothetical protein